MSFSELPENIQKAVSGLREAARSQRVRTTAEKNKLLKKLAQNLLSETSAILTANEKDLQALPASTAPAFRDRLTLNGDRLKGMAISLEQVAELPDPVGELVDKKTLANGLLVRRERGPLGVIFMIFESRPNVILEAFSLAFKSGNVILLRGGSESKFTSQCLYGLMNRTLLAEGFTQLPFFGIDDYERKIVENLLRCPLEIDIVVPRGGDRLIEFVQKTSLIPIIKNDRGLCHAYIAEDADLAMAVKIVDNGKTQRPGVCNSLETVLVHEKIAGEFIPALYAATDNKGLQWRVDEKSAQLLSGRARVEPATAESWNTEYLELILNCRVVKDLDQALKHIAQFGSKHSEVIVTRAKEKADIFLSEVDAAAVYWNASTRFTDGFEFGLGGELGISTQKLHVRGPVGLRELTIPRWIIEGNGQIRN